MDEPVELLPRDGLATEASDGVDDFDELLIGVAVLQLFVDVSQVVDVELALALGVEQSEVGLPAFLREGAALR